jgi:hypothetical protein
MLTRSFPVVLSTAIFTCLSVHLRRLLAPRWPIESAFGSHKSTSPRICVSAMTGSLKLTRMIYNSPVKHGTGVR